MTLSRPASLQVDNVQLRDEGTYRCRVDYQNAPTRNFQIHLTITGQCTDFVSINIKFGFRQSETQNIVNKCHFY